MKILSFILSLNPKTITVLFLISLSSIVYGQNRQIKCNNNVNDTGIYEENLAGEPFLLTEFYAGHNFFSDEWHNGSVVLENGKTIVNKIINYHLFSHQLLWIRSSDNSLICVEKAIVKEFIVQSNDSGKESLFRKLTIQPWGVPDSVEEYVQVLSRGYINLYVFRNSVIGKYSKKSIPEDNYFIQVNNGNIKRIKLSRRNLYSAVGDHDELMKRILRNNHLRIRHEYALIEAVNLFNGEMKEEEDRRQKTENR